MLKKLLLIIIAVSAFSSAASAQRWSVGTNVAQWANLGTINADASVAAGRHTSVGVGFRYNPWVFGGEEQRLQNKQRTAYVYGRWWPWNVYSGWWIGAKGQVEEYNQGGIFKRQAEQGDAYGLGISAGYTLMLHKHLNLDMGIGGWGGYTKYVVYACPTCGKVVDSGSKWFLMPDDVFLSLVYIF